MLTIRKVFIFLSTLPVWKYGIPWQLSKQISNLFFQISDQVYSVPGQTEGRRKAFLEWKSTVLSNKMNFLLHLGVMLTIIYIKVFINLFLLVGTEKILVIFKINQ